MRPFVSVIIPSYNHEAFVGEAIKSVLDQSYQDFEIVIADDGSQDRTPEIICRFADPRISLEVFQENRGAAAAVNSAIGRSHGEFLCYLSSDDLFLPGKLEKQVALLTENQEIAAVFGIPRFIDEAGIPLPFGSGFLKDTFQRPFTKNLRSRQDWLRSFFFDVNCLCHPSVMVRRSAYEEIGLFDPRLVNLSDFDMWVRLSMDHEICVMPDELVAFRIHSDNSNVSAPKRESLVRDMFEFFEILKHYKRMRPDFARQVFSKELSEEGIKSDGPLELWLAELALLGSRPAHRLFALDTMFEGLSKGTPDCRRLHNLTETLDVFQLFP